jgi:hypothetical protein
MRSNGNSKIIGAARAPATALVSATRPPLELLTTMMKKTTPTPMKVTGVMGSAAGV